MEQLTAFDKLLIGEKGLEINKLQAQLELFKKGIPPLDVLRPASLDDGILSFSKEEAIQYVAIYQKKKSTIDILKFVPASGAATRMFHFLSKFINEYKPDNQTFEEYITESNNIETKIFFTHLTQFAFYDTLEEYLTKNNSIKNLSEDEKKLAIARILLLEEPFAYQNKPKGLFPFHKYGNSSVTAFEEHFQEAVMYATQGEKVHIQFTISPDFTNDFLKKLAEIRPILEKRYQIQFEVSFTYQDSSTETIAVTLDNIPFRDDNDNLVFRPSGHGALLKNLNETTADIIFIKNIDNVVKQEYIDESIFYKEVLAGKLEEIRSRCHKILRQIQKNKIKKKDIPQILAFLIELNIQIPNYVYKFTKKNILEYIFEALNRPIRVCGMVKNEGEVGGGPFWVKDSEQNKYLQIIEASQIDFNNPKNKEIFNKSTHFNPVDIVCCIKNYRGETFDLFSFADFNQSLITQKTHNGQPIKALELPGLWNGGMAKWISIFVEVPVSTFNPVKSVNDLLKKVHQGN
ncbi:MAG: DUF4301 family protein [Capnocytophaga sp.]|nr:DUF4301 family protein [Capnocytophaga sp.]